MAELLWSCGPTLLLLGYFLGGLALYAIRSALWGPYRDAELAERETTLIGSGARHYFGWVTRPLTWLVARTGLRPSGVTVLSLGLTVCAAFALAGGLLSLAGCLFIAGGICDFLDGRLARATERSSAGGALLDSTLDRASDGAVIVGLAWFYRDSWVLLAVCVLGVAIMLVPYVRARAESLGVACSGGLMQRAERVMYLSLALALSPLLDAFVGTPSWAPRAPLAVVGILVVAAASSVTAGQRLAAGLRALDHRPAPPQTARVARPRQQPRTAARHA